MTADLQSAVQRVLSAWDTTTLKTNGDGMLSEAMESLRAGFDASLQAPAEGDAARRGLLPCPFCGRRPVLTVRPDNADATSYFAAVACFCDGYAACAHKDATASEADEAERLAREKWNGRAAHPQPKGSDQIAAKHRSDEMLTVDQAWEFWRPIICNDDGTLNMEQLKLELCDAVNFMGFAASVYDYATGGMCTKVNTLPSVVKTLIDDHVTEVCEENQAPAPAHAWRSDYPASEAELSAEREKARADERLYGLGATVNGWHVPAHVVSIYRLAQAAPRDGDVRELRKWLNEQPNRPIDRDALARLLHAVENAQPVGEIVTDCDGEAVLGDEVSWRAGMPPAGTKLYAAPCAAVGADDARDAARYRWLRSAGVDVPGCRVVIDETVRFLERLDVAIDAGIKGKK